MVLDQTLCCSPRCVADDYRVPVLTVVRLSQPIEPPGIRARTNFLANIERKQRNRRTFATLFPTRKAWQWLADERRPARGPRAAQSGYWLRGLCKM